LAKTRVQASSASKAGPHSAQKAEFFVAHRVVRQFARDVSSRRIFFFGDYMMLFAVSIKMPGSRVRFPLSTNFSRTYVRFRAPQ
jgi:hypothetical protein